MTVADAAARGRAVDPALCCCVSAPAGSGKTELLIQRCLALLARVPEPEQVVAITFTRKAAAEMRARLLGALSAAAAGLPVPDPHLAHTRTLADAVLRADRERAWGLLSTPSRLRILTIDSFCGELTRQMPLLSGCGGELRRVDDATHLYRQAVANLLADCGDRATPWVEDLRALLLHLDNDWESALELLQALLSRRDQWLPLLGGGGLGEGARGDFRDVVLRLWETLLGELTRLLQPWSAELETVLGWRRDNLALAAPASAHDAARECAALLLTQGGTWRRSLTKREGFPSGDEAAKSNKQRATALIESLASSPEAERLRMQLQRLGDMPEPADDPRHWEALTALTRVLPRLVAELLLVFRQAGEVDHAQVSLAALEALGEDEAPSELALRLDHRIEHLLVDEFQDTSSGQYELLRRLTRGWVEHNAQHPEAPRTLMVVGDAMQSIYGFRDANVGLFIRAREQGIGGLPLEPLSLQVNFRSQGALVAWVNDTFGRAFPEVDDADLGAVSFRPALAQQPANGAPLLELFEGEDAAARELQWICEQIATGVSDEGVASIAVLGRSRNLLRPLLARMRAAGIAFRGRDLDPLEQRMVISDLLVLCRVLSNQHDPYAWLCLLRAPWGGLDHGQLLEVSRTVPTAAALAAGCPVGLSSPLRERLDTLRGVLQWAEHYRDRVALRTWIEESWLRLGGPATLSGPGDHDDAEQFFRCVEALEQEGRGLQIEALEERIRHLYAAGGEPTSKVEVMTLHRAKGLEFDWVFIPSLHAATGRGGNELLLWDEFTEAGGDTAFLFDLRSARDAREGQRIFDLLRARQKQKRALETTRLLYVGCTRAAERLFLSGCVQRDERSEALRAPTGSLLHTLLPALTAQPQTQVQSDAAVATPTGPDSGPAYRRVTGLPMVEVPHAASSVIAPELPQNRLARSYGTALHRCMESLALRDQLPAQCDDALRRLLRSALLQAGCEPQALDSHLSRGVAALDRALADEWTRWMLSPQRGERRAELPLTVVLEGDLKQLVVDYSFLDVEGGERWVVDYKTAVPAAGETQAMFLQRELERYREQLEAYRHALAAIYPEPVRCALYFPELACVRELPAPA
jgi:ATP-dependent helicase/nuclease subunit A